MVRGIGIFATLCGWWVTFYAPAAVAARGTDTLASAVVEHGELVLTLTGAGPTVLAHVYLPNPDAALPVLTPWRGKPVAVKRAGVDRYGRLQAILTPPDGPSLQESLLRSGHAVVQHATSFPQEAAWRRLERPGLLPQATPDTAADYHQQLAEVTGQVTRIYEGRSAFEAHFGTDWKTDFSLRIPRRAFRAFGGAPDIAVGDQLRVRGTVIADGGPMILVTRPGQLEERHANPR